MPIRTPVRSPVTDLTIRRDEAEAAIGDLRYTPLRWDGATHATRGATLTGVVNGKEGTVLAIGRPADTSITNYFQYTTSFRGAITRIGSSGLYQISARRSAGSVTILVMDSTKVAVPGRLDVMVASWNLATTTAHMYLNGEDVANITTILNDTIDYDDIDYAHGGNTAGSTLAKGEWIFAFWTSYINLGTAANRAKFYNDQRQMPVDIGATGSAPGIGLPKALFRAPLAADPSSDLTNFGTGGDLGVGAGAAQTGIPIEFAAA
jgi:hypothetical protein